jgi:hypothetical protein
MVYDPNSRRNGLHLYVVRMSNECPLTSTTIIIGSIFLFIFGIVTFMTIIRDFTNTASNNVRYESNLNTFFFYYFFKEVSSMKGLKYRSFKSFIVNICVFVLIQRKNSFGLFIIFKVVLRQSLMLFYNFVLFSFFFTLFKFFYQREIHYITFSKIPLITCMSLNILFKV